MYRASFHDGLAVFRDGRLRLLTMHDQPDIGWTLKTSWQPDQSREAANAPAIKRVFRGFSWPDGHIPYWQPVIFAAVLGAAPWLLKLPWRFSLRTLLIATTLVAIALGMVVYAAKN